MAIRRRVETRRYNMYRADGSLGTCRRYLCEPESSFCKRTRAVGSPNIVALDFNPA